MSKVIKEISCITGSYTSANGEKKNRYSRIGSIIETRNGPMLKLDAVPLKEGGWDGWAYINDPRTDDKPAQERKAAKFDDDNIPF